jgi:hypothetical protein
MAVFLPALAYNNSPVLGAAKTPWMKDHGNAYLEGLNMNGLNRMSWNKIYWSYLIYCSLSSGLSLFSAHHASNFAAANNPLGGHQSAMTRVQHDLAHQGYTTFEDSISCPITRGDLDALTAIFDRIAIPYKEKEEDAHNNAQEFVVIFSFSESTDPVRVGVRNRFIINDISVSNNNITNDDINKVVMVVHQILNLLGDEDLGSVFTVHLTYYDEFRKKAEAFEAKAASIKEPILETLKVDDLPWHQDKFGTHLIDFLGLFVLDAVGIRQNFLQLGLLDKNSLMEHEKSASNACVDSRPEIIANILGQQGAGYLVDQSRVFDSSVIVHRRTVLQTYFSNSPLIKNLLMSDPEFFETTVHEYPTWHNNCASADYVRPSRKVLIVRIKKNSDI